MTLILADVDLSADDVSMDYRFAGDPICPACDEPVRCHGAIRDRSAAVWERWNNTPIVICDCSYQMEVRQ